MSIGNPTFDPMSHKELGSESKKMKAAEIAEALFDRGADGSCEADKLNPEVKAKLLELLKDLGGM